METRTCTATANGIAVAVTTAGNPGGPPILLLHGWPHTSLLWRDVIAELAPRHRLIAPDLRGIGATERPTGGYDLHTLADDAAGVLDALGVSRAAVVGIDAGVAIAWMLARRRPDRVTRLIVMEGLIGRLPGAEQFLRQPPWWFGFHAVPGLAEAVVAGHEAEYLDWFHANGTWQRRGLDPAMRAAFLAAYRGRDALRGGFEHYRAAALNAEQIDAASRAEAGRAVPTLALAGGVVGDALQRQLAPVTDTLSGATVPDAAHILPVDRPQLLSALVGDFVSPRPRARRAARG